MNSIMLPIIISKYIINNNSNVKSNKNSNKNKNKKVKKQWVIKKNINEINNEIFNDEISGVANKMIFNGKIKEYIINRNINDKIIYNLYNTEIELLNSHNKNNSINVMNEYYHETLGWVIDNKY
jgi:Txe/YoeB family toxin of Txe-Axe toxin-antitoxin module